MSFKITFVLKREAQATKCSVGRTGRINWVGEERLTETGVLGADGFINSAQEQKTTDAKINHREGTESRTDSPGAWRLQSGCYSVITTAVQQDHPGQLLLFRKMEKGDTVSSRGTHSYWTIESQQCANSTAVGKPPASNHLSNLRNLFLRLMQLKIP